jgi:hypothetical protein
MRKIEKTVYTFSELEPRAQAHALGKYRENFDFSFHSECVIEYAKECAALVGIDIDKVYYSGFWSQGDGASFDGWYYYKKGAAQAIREHAPQDKDLLKIASALQAIQRRHFYSIGANVTRSGYYVHENTMRADVFDTRTDWNVSNDIAEEVLDVLRDFARWIYRSLETEYEFQTKDETIIEELEQLNYEFDEDGNQV